MYYECTKYKNNSQSVLYLFLVFNNISNSEYNNITLRNYV